MAVEPDTGPRDDRPDDASRLERQVTKRGIWRLRAKRVATGLNVFVSLLLALAVWGMANYLGSRYFARWHLSGDDYYSLSDKTRGLIGSLEQPVEIVVFFQRGHALYDDVRGLLKEYEYEAAGTRPVRLKIEMVDPDRDLARTRELAQEFDVDKPNVVVVRSGTRVKHVETKALADYQYSLDEGRSIKKKKVGFRGEQAISSAIQSVASGRRPVVYFLQGHGERSLEDFSELKGYSDLARLLERDNIEARSLVLAARGRVPDDADAVVIAGPEARLAEEEVALLNAYLKRNGRLMVMLEPLQQAGLEGLLLEWGVRLAKDIVVGLSLSSGRDLVAKNYGDHPVTRRIEEVVTMFYLPRSVEPALGSEASKTAVDRPSVTPLVMTTASGWAEYNITQRPARFDPGVDRKGPIPVAVAIEKGPVKDIDIEIKPTRMIVVGDCDFVSNGGLKRGLGGNPDFFMSAMNWLIEREALMAIAAKSPQEMRLDMSRREWRAAYLITAVAIPVAVLFFGFIIGWVRRR